MNSLDRLISIVDGGLMPKLSHRALKVLLVYARHADSDGEAFPSAATLAKRIGCKSTSHACCARAELVAAGLLECISEGGGRGFSSRYQLALPTIETTPKSGVDMNEQTRPGSGVDSLESTPEPGVLSESETTPDLDKTTPDSGAKLRPSRAYEEDTKQTFKADKVRGVETTPGSGADKKTRADGNLPPVPASLDTPQFRAVWGDWVQHRRERKPKLTPTAAKHQLGQLEAMGAARAIIALHHSIASGWQGIFEPRGNGNGKNAPSPRMASASRTEIFDF